MYNRFIITGLALGVVLTLVGCNSSLLSKPMAFNDVEYVQEFPRTFSLSEGEAIDLNIIDLMSIVVQDSLLIVSNQDKDGCWSFYSIPDYRPLGKYLRIGRGPGEIVEAPSVGTQSFFKEDGKLNTYIYEFNTGRVLCMDITKTLADGIISMTDVKAGLPKNLFSMMPLDTNVFFCRELNRSFTTQDRFIFSEGKRIITSNMTVLNSAIIVKADIRNTNLLNSISAYDSSKDLIVEASMFQNAINVYNAHEGPVGKTFCYGDKLVDVTKPSSLMDDAYCRVIGYDFYFAALYKGYDFYKYDNKGKAMHPRIQFFGWDPCEPLAEIVLDRDVTGFDIDFRSGKLYTVSYNTEEICVYDIKDVLEYLPN